MKQQVNLSFKLPCRAAIFIPLVVLVGLPLLLVCTMVAGYLTIYWNEQFLIATGEEVILEEIDASFRAKIAKDYVERHELDSPTDFYYLPKKGDKCDGRLFNCTKMSHEKEQRTILYSRRCDGIPDCLGGSDEQHCMECQTHFSCPAVDGISQVCVRASQLCDGIADCPQGEDELLKFCHLVNKTMHMSYHEYEKKAQLITAPYYQQCNLETHIMCLGRCLPIEFKCDGEIHCPIFNDRGGVSTGVDEQDCDQCNGKAQFCPYKVETYLFNGPSGKCIPHYELCDHVLDCLDHSDETHISCPNEAKNCAGACNLNAPDSDSGRNILEFRQQQQLGVLKPFGILSQGSNRNNGKVRCDNGEFLYEKYACSGLYPHCERGCEYCTMGAFQCENSTQIQCVEMNRICDGISDCLDESDEAHCENVTMKCDDGFRLCNGFSDCEDGRDERNCTECARDVIVRFLSKEEVQKLPLMYSYMTNHPLPMEIQKAFHCEQEQRCIPSFKRCDGHEDCLDASDEKICTCAECLIHPKQVYICQQGMRCFEYGEVCNGTQTRCPNPSQIDIDYCHKKQ